MQEVCILEFRKILGNREVSVGDARFKVTFDHDRREILLEPLDKSYAKSFVLAEYDEIVAFDGGFIEVREATDVDLSALDIEELLPLSQILRSPPSSHSPDSVVQLF